MNEMLENFYEKVLYFQRHTLHIEIRETNDAS